MITESKIAMAVFLFFCLILFFLSHSFPEVEKRECKQNVSDNSSYFTYHCIISGIPLFPFAFLIRQYSLRAVHKGGIFLVDVVTLLKLLPAESFSLGRSSCSWASRMSTSCSISRTEELTSPAKMGPLVCLANSLAKLAAFSPLRICGGVGGRTTSE